MRRTFRQPPADLVAAKRRVDARLEYAYYRSLVRNSKVYERKPEGLAAHQRNCVGFALEYQRELGGRGSLFTFRHPELGWHTVLHVDGWSLDVMHRDVRQV